MHAWGTSLTCVRPSPAQVAIHLCYSRSHDVTMLEPQAQAAALQQPRAEHPAPCQQPAQVQELLHVNGIESAEGPERPPRPLRHAEYGPLSASLRAIQEGLELERYGAEVVELRAEVWALSAALLQAHEVAARRAVQVGAGSRCASGMRPDLPGTRNPEPHFR